MLTPFRFRRKRFSLPGSLSILILTSIAVDFCLYSDEKKEKDFCCQHFTCKQGFDGFNGKSYLFAKVGYFQLFLHHREQVVYEAQFFLRPLRLIIPKEFASLQIVHVENIKLLHRCKSFLFKT
ncbi:MAG: hypothetical protein LBH32_15455 [Dysgonamonadaceae bacterium]|jgi:hypothetical protein|nr:hypothetical protein [Dysgonamonadaceae bacterium]